MRRMLSIHLLGWFVTTICFLFPFSRAFTADVSELHALAQLNGTEELIQQLESEKQSLLRAKAIDSSADDIDADAWRLWEAKVAVVQSIVKADEASVSLKELGSIAELAPELLRAAPLMGVVLTSFRREPRHSSASVEPAPNQSLAEYPPPRRIAYVTENLAPSVDYAQSLQLATQRAQNSASRMYGLLQARSYMLQELQELVGQVLANFEDAVLLSGQPVALRFGASRLSGLMAQTYVQKLFAAKSIVIIHGAMRMSFIAGETADVVGPYLDMYDGLLKELNILEPLPKSDGYRTVLKSHIAHEFNEALISELDEIDQYDGVRTQTVDLLTEHIEPGYRCASRRCLGYVLQEKWRQRLSVPSDNLAWRSFVDGFESATTSVQSIGNASFLPDEWVAFKSGRINPIADMINETNAWADRFVRGSEVRVPLLSVHADAAAQADSVHAFISQLDEERTVQETAELREWLESSDESRRMRRAMRPQRVAINDFDRCAMTQTTLWGAPAPRVVSVARRLGERISKPIRAIFGVLASGLVVVAGVASSADGEESDEIPVFVAGESQSDVRSIQSLFDYYSPDQLEATELNELQAVLDSNSGTP